jgi:hypothetical protein
VSNPSRCEKCQRYHGTIAVVPLALALLFAGCGMDTGVPSANPDPPGSPGTSSSPTDGPTDGQASPTPQTTGTPTSPGTPPAGHVGEPATGDVQDTDRRVAFARQQVADRFGHPVEDIHVVTVEKITWPSTALGCPDHEQTYDQTPVAGYRIVLRWDTVEFHFHGRDDEPDPFQCEFLD